MKKNTPLILPDHLGIYIRVSTQQQASEGISTHEQRESGIKKANQLGWQYTIYDDSAQSGSISYLDRPGMRQLMLDVDAKKLGGMFSVDIDRWSRDGKYEEPQIIISIFKKSGIKIFTPSGELNLQDPNIEFMSRIQGLTSSYYRIQTQSKIKRALLQSAIDGNAGGGALMPFGYKKNKKILIINESESKVVEIIFKMYLEGKGSFAIADFLNVNKFPTKRNSSRNGDMTIKRGEVKKTNGDIIPEGKVIKKADEFTWRDKTVLGILKNPIYKGERRFKDITVQSPIIIEPVIFDAVQTLIAEKKHFREAPFSKTEKKTNRFLLKGLVKCATCGQSFYGKKRKDLKDNAYCCLSQRYKSEFCGTPGISIDFLDHLVWTEVKSIKKNVEKYFKEFEESDDVKSFQSIITKKTSEINELEKNLLTLNRRYNEGKLTDNEYNPLREEYLKELTENIETKEHFLAKLKSLEQKESVLNMIESFTSKIANFDKVDFDEKQTVIRALIQKVRISPKHAIFIKYRLDNLTDILLQKEYEIGYKKNGHRLGIINEKLVFNQLKHIHPVSGNIYNAIFHMKKGEE